MTLLWINFLLAVAASIGYGGYRLVAELRDFDSARFLIFPAALFGIQLFFWWRFYRRRDRTAQVVAGLVGTWLLLQIVMRLLPGAGQVASPRWILGLLGYFAVSHLLYAAVPDRTRGTIARGRP